MVTWWCSVLLDWGVPRIVVVMVAVGEACGRNVEDRADGERRGQEGRGNGDKNVSNIRSIEKRTSASHHRVGAKEDERERKSNGVRWLLCRLMFERASFRPISSHEKGPGERARDEMRDAIMRGMDPGTGG